MPPNILWIVLEDTSPRLGCYGDGLARTPRIDQLAARGRRYDRMFSTTGVCAPSRASLVTGMMPQSLGAHHMRTETHDVPGLPDSYECVPPHYVTAVSEYLRKAGYYCTLDIKTDYQFGEPPTMWDHHGADAGWWDPERDPEQPFFAMMTKAVTHESGMWDPRDDWPNAEGRTITTPETNPAMVTVPPYLLDTDATRQAIARQYDNIAALDRWVGALLDRLETDGHADDTVVILVGDHGEGLPRKKRWPYDTGTHVPLIVRWPGRTNGGSSDRLVSGVDIAPTTLSIADISPPQYMEGSPVLGPFADTPRDVVVTTRDRVDESYDMIRSVRGDRFRYVRHYYPNRPFVQHIPYRDRHPAMKELLRAHARGELDPDAARWFRTSRPAEELFDLVADPHEMENLAHQDGYAETLDRFRARLDEWRIRTGDRRAESEAEMRRRMWPSGSQPETTAPTFVMHGPAGTRMQRRMGRSLTGPITVGLYCPTEGASLSWSIDDGRWRLYDGPLRIPGGDTRTIRARAVRYGYAASDVTTGNFRVQ